MGEKKNRSAVESPGSVAVCAVHLLGRSPPVTIAVSQGFSEIYADQAIEDLAAALADEIYSLHDVMHETIRDSRLIRHLSPRFETFYTCSVPVVTPGRLLHTEAVFLPRETGLVYTGAVCLQAEYSVDNGEADDDGPRVRGEGKDTIALRQVIADVLAGFDGPMSGRQIFYQCVSLGAVENNAKGRGQVLRLILKMRRDGSIAYSRIVDRTRAKHHRAGWDNVSEALDGWRQYYRRDLWQDQKTIPMIACEKAALEGIFSQVVDEYGASLWTLRGFNSESFEYEWAEEVRELNAAGKNVIIYYFGDFDPSGLSIEETSRRKLEAWGAKFTWVRAGLLLEDFDRFNLIRIPVKAGDSRAKAFLSKFDRAAELDALKPAELERRIRESIENHIDRERWNRMVSVEKAEKESLDLVIGNWGVAVEAARGAA